MRGPPASKGGANIKERSTEHVVQISHRISEVFR